MKKVYTTHSNKRLIVSSLGENCWQLEDTNRTVYFNGSPTEINNHIDEMLKKGEYTLK